MLKREKSRLGLGRVVAAEGGLAMEGEGGGFKAGGYVVGGARLAVCATRSSLPTGSPPRARLVRVALPLSRGSSKVPEPATEKPSLPVAAQPWLLSQWI